jgi:ribonucleotide monophosphatase NagD (HAD superfamily)
MRLAAVPELIQRLQDAHAFIHRLNEATPDEAIDFLTNNGEQVEADIEAALKQAGIEV